MELETHCTSHLNSVVWQMLLSRVTSKFRPSAVCSSAMVSDMVLREDHGRTAALLMRRTSCGEHVQKQKNSGEHVQKQKNSYHLSYLTDILTSVIPFAW